MKLNLKICLSLVVSVIFFNFATAEIVPGLETYGDLTLVDSIECATDTQHSFREFPAGRSYVSNILGQACIVMHHVKTSETSNGNESSAYMSWRIGKGKNLVPSDPYLFVVEYPDDAPRSSTIINRGAPTRRGFHTGITVGDALSPPYVMNFPESYEIPLTQGFEKIEQVMYLVEKAVTYNEQGSRMDTSVEGFDIAFALFPQEDQKASHGVALKSIKLYHINDEENLKAKITYPKGNTPRRVVTFREEMSDDGGHASFADPVQWYRNKGRLMSALGMNTYSRDLLEFGYCQYWDPAYNNYGDGWMNYNYEMRGLWEQVVTVMGEQGHNLFPLYEYAGGRGAWDSLGNKKLVKPLFIDTKTDARFNNQDYQENCLVDITSAAAHEDFKKVLDCTIIRFKDKANFLGSWVRSRGQMPVSFHENTVALFCQEKGYDSATVTRRYIADQGMNSDIYKEYMAWWYLKRVEFFNEMQKYLEENGVANAKSFYTSCPAETGEYAYNWWGGTVANNDTWANVSGESAISVGAATWNYNEYCLKREWPTWGNYEFFHTTPTDDPQNYANLKNVGLTYPFNRVYTVVGGYDKSWRNSSDDLFFVRHHSLNENALTDENGTHILGYYTADFEKAGRGCMLSELWSMAICDPTMIGYLFGYDLGRNNAKPVREFNQNFLALPATKSTVVSGGYWGAELTVRRWDTEESGTYFAVINTSTKEFKNQNIKFTNNSSEFDKIYRVVGGQKYAVTSGAIDVDIQPLEMITFSTEPPESANATIGFDEVSHNSASVVVQVPTIGESNSAELTIVVSDKEDFSNPVGVKTATITEAPTTITNIFTGLQPNTKYYCQVTLVAGESTITRKASVTTQIDPIAPDCTAELVPVDENNATLTIDVSMFGEGSSSASISLVLTPTISALPTISWSSDVISSLGKHSFNVFGMSSEITYSVDAIIKNNLGYSTKIEMPNITMPALESLGINQGSYISGLTQVKYTCAQGKLPDYGCDFNSLDQSVIDVTPGTVMADVQDSNSLTNRYVNPYSGKEWKWGNNTTYAYFGEMYFEAGVTYNFASIIDDGSTLFIDEEKIFENSNYSKYGAGSYTPTATGWLPIEVYVFDWTGGKGPSGHGNNQWKSYTMGFGWNTNGITSTSNESDWSRLRTPDNGVHILRTRSNVPVLVELNPFVSRVGKDLVANVTTKAVDSDSVLKLYSSNIPLSPFDTEAWTNEGYSAMVQIGEQAQECIVSNVDMILGEKIYVIARLINERTGYDVWSDVATYTVAESLTTPEINLALTSVGYRDASFSIVVSSIGAGESADVMLEIFDLNGNLVKSYTIEENITETKTIAFTTPYELSYNTGYKAVVTITNAQSESSSAEVDFKTNAATAPAASINVINAEYTSARIGLSITDFGIDCNAVDVTLQVSEFSDFSSLIADIDVGAVSDSTREINVSGLHDNGVFYVRAILVNGNSITTTTETTSFNTLEYTAPVVASPIVSDITYNAISFTLPLTDMGAGSSSVTATATLNTGDKVTATLNKLGDFCFSFDSLDELTEYTCEIVVKGSNGKQTTSNISITTFRFPLALDAPSTTVSDDGNNASISISVDWIDSPADLALYLGDNKVEEWKNVSEKVAYSYNLPTSVGETYSYRFVLSATEDSNVRTTKLGSFVAQAVDGWFDVKFEDEGYNLGASWTNISEVTSPGGEWIKSSEDATELVNVNGEKYLELNNSSTVPLIYKPTEPSKSGKDARIIGRAKFVAATKLEVPPAGVQYAVVFKYVGDNLYPFVYCNGAWIQLTGPALAEDKWYDYQIEFDYSSDLGPQAQLFIDGELYKDASTGAIWLPVSSTAHCVTKLGFTGKGAIGNFSGLYYDTVIEDEEEEDIVLTIPQIGSASGEAGSSGGGSGLEFIGNGDNQVFSITISNPVKGAYYTPFVVTDLNQKVWVAATDSVKAEGDEFLVLDIDSSVDDTKFVKIVVSYPESYNQGAEKTFK